MRRLVIPLVAVVALTGCTTTSSNSSKEFSGAEADVAKVVDDLQTAGRRKDAARVCGELLARNLVTQMDAGRGSCQDEIGKAMDDADDFSLDVQDVTVTGNTATARVRGGDEGPTATLGFVREANRWKVSELG